MNLSLIHIFGRSLKKDFYRFIASDLDLYPPYKSAELLLHHNNINDDVIFSLKISVFTEIRNTRNFQPCEDDEESTYCWYLKLTLNYSKSTRVFQEATCFLFVRVLIVSCSRIQIIHNNNRATVTLTVEPVSYTHLDVYKRQVTGKG